MKPVFAFLSIHNTLIVIYHIPDFLFLSRTCIQHGYNYWSLFNNMVLACKLSSICPFYWDEIMPNHFELSKYIINEHKIYFKQVYCNDDIHYVRCTNSNTVVAGWICFWTLNLITYIYISVYNQFDDECCTIIQMFIFQMVLSFWWRQLCQRTGISQKTEAVWSQQGLVPWETIYSRAFGDYGQRTQ